MAWYIDKFNDFFTKWKRGYLYTKAGQTHYGMVEKLNFKDDFKKSFLSFTSLEAPEKGAEKFDILLKEIVYFRAAEGPIFNVGKYLSIVEMQEKAAAKEEVVEKKEKEPVCIAFGLEFYASPKVARTLKADIRDLLLKRLKDSPLVFVKEQPPVELTPAFSSVIKRIGSLFRRGQTQKSPPHPRGPSGQAR